jgi:ectoine hydroxylase-related dioxygenase (phytanoyl-CoA dioxygenase family)
MSTTTAAPKVLSAPQIQQYRQHGYCVPGRQLLPPEELAAVATTFERLSADWIAAGGRTEHMDVPHFYHPELFHWLLHDAVLDVVEDLIGPDIVLFASHFIAKPGGNGKRVPWHEDSAYWAGLWEPMEAVTVWLALDDSTPENGCMRVIPGSHRNGYSSYAEVEDAPQSVFATEIRTGQFDAASAVDCVLGRGEYSLHHAKCIHGSNANTSSRRRCGYTMRYISAHSRFASGDSERRQVHRCYLARGRDHAGNHYGEPFTVNQAWVDRYPPKDAPKGH